MSEILQSVVDGFVASAMVGAELEKKTNDELADLLMIAWGDLHIFSANSALLEVVMDRLRGLKKCEACDGTGAREFDGSHFVGNCAACGGEGQVKEANK